MDGPLGIVFVGYRIPEEGKNAITQKPRDIPSKRFDDRLASLLIGPNDPAQIFRIQLLG